MSGISKFIEKISVQTAVYWGSPIPNGFGGYDFSVGIEIKCRWDETLNNITNKFGKEILSKAKILTPSELDVNGYLFLGTLDDIDSSQQANPLIVTGAWEIQRIDKTPLIKSKTEFVKTIYL